MTKMVKKNEMDLTPNELNNLVQDFIDDNDYDGAYEKASEICVEFLDEYILKNLTIFQQTKNINKNQICTKILDSQKPNERFSITLERLGGI